MKKRGVRSKALIVGLGILLSAGRLVSAPGGGDVTPRDKAAYLAALRDSADARQTEISRKLVAIVPFRDAINRAALNGGSLVWEGEPGSSRILVAAFMSREAYEKYYKENLEAGRGQYILMKSLWVTVVPELRNFFRGGRSGSGAVIPSAKRVMQLLGLHPAYDYEVILEMYADPADLFRPSADPEISDHEAELAVPPLAAENGYVINNGSEWIFPRDRNPFLALRTDAFFKDSKWSSALTYKEWFSERADTIYTVGSEDDPETWGWPWTRLGYTYDWGNAQNPVGLSEFVLRVDPNRNGGEAVVRLVQAVDAASGDWIRYFAGKN